VPDPAPAVLAEVVRSGFVEGRHRGSLVLLDPDGSVVLALGDPSAPVLPRSCLKPAQGVGLLELGYPGRGPDLALAVASHWGEPAHVAGVRRILASAGLAESDLATPPDWPGSQAARDDLVRAGGGPAPVLMNCSGKHAAMLATCAVQGWPRAGYLDPEHPLQRHLLGSVERLTGEPVVATAVDGCGAPAWALSLVGLARLYARVVTAEPGSRERAVADAMRAHPELVGGVGHDVTRLMQAVPGLLVKDGAEGVYAGALPDGRAFALKLDDGAARARPVVAAAVLRRWGAATEGSDDAGRLVLLGGGRPVGEVRVPAGPLSSSA
jgi:L-asparaginase II